MNIIVIIIMYFKIKITILIKKFFVYQFISTEALKIFSRLRMTHYWSFLTTCVHFGANVLSTLTTCVHFGANHCRKISTDFVFNLQVETKKEKNFFPVNKKSLDFSNRNKIRSIQKFGFLTIGFRNTLIHNVLCKNFAKFFIACILT